MPLAEQDLEEAYEYIRQDNLQAAARLAKRILEAVKMLNRFPAAGRPGRVPTTRELPISATPFIVVYRLTENEVQILAVMHGARRWPASFGEKA